MFARPTLALAALLSLTMPGFARQQDAPTATELVSIMPRFDAPALAQLPELPGLPALPKLERGQPTAPPARCVPTLPTPSGRWAGRKSDYEWARGLYPAVNDYGDGLALTFDDGPHLTRTPLALDGLARHHMHATFFLTGHSIRASSYHLVQRMVAEGHALANHGWRHDTNMAALGEGSATQLRAYVRSEFELTQIRVDLAMLADSPEHFAELDSEVFAGLHRFVHDRDTQLARMAKLRTRHLALLERYGYSETQRPHAMGYVRPPGGNPYIGGRWTVRERELFAKEINAMGLTMVMWNSGSGDSNTKLSPAQRRDPERVAQTALAGARKGGIYIAHDRIAPEALDAMLLAFANSGVEIVSLDDLRHHAIEALDPCGSQPSSRTLSP